MANQQIVEVIEDLTKQLDPNPNIGEKVLASFFCIVMNFNMTTKTYDKIGPGMAQILENETNKRRRVLIRDKNDLNKSLMNFYLLGFCEPKIVESYIQLAAENYDGTNPNNKSKVIYRLRIAKENKISINEILQIINESIEANKKLV